MKQVLAFTDGACSGNPGPGGWGAVLQFGDHERELHGGARDTTNNRMELTAAIEALKALNEPCRVSLTTDSTYVKDGITQWLANWKRKGWKTAAKKPVKNKDLWQTLDHESAPHEIDSCWVKGHRGHPENERADRLANLGMDEVRDANG